MSRANLCALCLSLLTSACAVPQAELNQANNSAALMMSLDSDIGDFSKSQSLVLQASKNSTEDFLQSIQKNKTRISYETSVDVAANFADKTSLIKKLLDLADNYAKGERDLASQLAIIDSSLKTAFTQLPNPSPQLSSTRDLMVKMGEQLSSKERLELLTEYAKASKKSYDNAKASLDEAEKQAKPDSGTN